jgi:hypothetical protein
VRNDSAPLEELSKFSASFLYNATRSLFEQAGFCCHPRKGINHCLMSKTVPGERWSAHRPLPGQLMSNSLPSGSFIATA